MHSFCGKVNHLSSRARGIESRLRTIFFDFFPFQKKVKNRTFGVEIANECVWWCLENLRTAERQTRARANGASMYVVPVKGRRRRAALHLRARAHMLKAALQRKLSHR
jgi:hypothetical protein